MFIAIQIEKGARMTCLKGLTRKKTILKRAQLSKAKHSILPQTTVKRGGGGVMIWASCTATAAVALIQLLIPLYIGVF